MYSIHVWYIPQTSSRFLNSLVVEEAHLFIFICQSAVQLLFSLALKNVTKSINAFYDLPADEGKEINFFSPKINSNYSYESSEWTARCWERTLTWLSWDEAQYIGQCWHWSVAKLRAVYESSLWMLLEIGKKSKPIML